jgi:hypothetical protein
VKEALLEKMVSKGLLDLLDYRVNVALTAQLVHRVLQEKEGQMEKEAILVFKAFRALLVNRA